MNEDIDLSKPDEITDEQHERLHEEIKVLLEEYRNQSERAGARFDAIQGVCFNKPEVFQKVSRMISEHLIGGMISMAKNLPSSLHAALVSGLIQAVLQTLEGSKVMNEEEYQKFVEESKRELPPAPKEQSRTIDSLPENYLN